MTAELQQLPGFDALFSELADRDLNFTQSPPAATSPTRCVPGIIQPRHPVFDLAVPFPKDSHILCGTVPEKTLADVPRIVFPMNHQGHVRHARPDSVLHYPSLRAHEPDLDLTAHRAMTETEILEPRAFYFPRIQKAYVEERRHILPNIEEVLVGQRHSVNDANDFRPARPVRSDTLNTTDSGIGLDASPRHSQRRSTSSLLHPEPESGKDSLEERPSERAPDYSPSKKAVFPPFTRKRKAAAPRDEKDIGDVVDSGHNERKRREVLNLQTKMNVKMQPDESSPVQLPKSTGNHGEVIDPITQRPRKRQLIDSDPKYNTEPMIDERRRRRGLRRSIRLSQKRAARGGISPVIKH